MVVQISDQIKKLEHRSDYPESSTGMMLASLVYCNNPVTILEIGYNLGYSAVWLCAGVKMSGQKAKVVSVDIEECDGGDVVRSFGFDNHVFIQGDSRDVQPQVQEILGSKIDFLFLDGEHTYDALSQEWAIYSPMVSEYGLVVLHDMYMPALQRVIDEMDPTWNVTYLGGWGSLSLARRDKYHNKDFHMSYLPGEKIATSAEVSIVRSFAEH